MRFSLLNGIKKSDVRVAKFVIYAHSCPGGVYVGMSSDPVKRWSEHTADASNANSPYFNDSLKKAIRAYKQNFQHYVIGLANLEKSARQKEASAIRFYGKNLNDRLEIEPESRDYGFRPIDSQIGNIEFLQAKSSSTSNSARQDSDRVLVVGEIYEEFGRKRVRTIAGQAFPAGLNIECSREERARFKPGDLVKIKVAMSEKADGTKYLTAAKTSPLLPAK